MKVEIIKQYGYHFLWIDKKLWMWDIPSEVKIEKEMAEQCYGHVLIAGYGIGLIHSFLADMPKVKSITTIEIHPEVVDACRDTFGKVYGTIIYADFFKYTLPCVFDCVVGDVWEEIHPKFLPDYLKFKEHAVEFLKQDGKIISWGMDYYEFLAQKGKTE